MTWLLCPFFALKKQNNYFSGIKEAGLLFLRIFRGVERPFLSLVPSTSGRKRSFLPDSKCVSEKKSFAFSGWQFPLFPPWAFEFKTLWRYQREGYWEQSHVVSAALPQLTSFLVLPGCQSVNCCLLLVSTGHSQARQVAQSPTGTSPKTKPNKNYGKRTKASNIAVQPGASVVGNSIWLLSFHVWIKLGSSTSCMMSSAWLGKSKTYKKRNFFIDLHFFPPWFWGVFFPR